MYTSIEKYCTYIRIRYNKAVIKNSIVSKIVICGFSRTPAERVSGSRLSFLSKTPQENKVCYGISRTQSYTSEPIADTYINMQLKLI